MSKALFLFLRSRSKAHRTRWRSKQGRCFASARQRLNCLSTWKIQPRPVNPLHHALLACWDDCHYSNSFDVFIRGVEIISGGQCIHDAELLTKQVIECGIDVNTLSSYIDSSGRGQCHMEELE